VRRLSLLLLTSLVLAALPADPSLAGADPRPHEQRGDLAAATTCPSRVELRAADGVVLLVHGTGERSDESWSWSYEPALAAEGIATCSVQLPNTGLGPLAPAARVVRAAVRVTARLADHPIGVVGHSQGGFLAVWVTTFWPRLAPLVTDAISLGGSFGGTALADELCAAGRCAPLAWQLRQGSDHVAALVDAFRPGRVPVTSIATRYDEIVRPQPEASLLPGATNVLLQDVCAQDPSEHAMLLGDPVAFDLVLDALRHPGPADVARLPAETCSQAFIRGGDPAGAPVLVQGVARFFTGLADPRRWVDAEPPLPRYAR
jgi:pimeloyl-ACP methyl ester carboxylesterase